MKRHTHSPEDTRRRFFETSAEHKVPGGYDASDEILPESERFSEDERAVANIKWLDEGPELSREAQRQRIGFRRMRKSLSSSKSSSLEKVAPVERAIRDAGSQIASAQASALAMIDDFVESYKKAGIFRDDFHRSAQAALITNLVFMHDSSNASLELTKKLVNSRDIDELWTLQAEIVASYTISVHKQLDALSRIIRNDRAFIDREVPQMARLRHLAYFSDNQE